MQLENCHYPLPWIREMLEKLHDFTFLVHWIWRGDTIKYLLRIVVDACWPSVVITGNMNGVVYVLELS
jgi:hypothetical protein